MGKMIGGEVACGADAPIDWMVLKDDIIRGLNVAEEFKALGLKLLDSKPNGRGVIVCHAADREDSIPSAFINPTTGVYHDSGTGKTCGLFDFALEYGGFGQWFEVVKHYAAKAGVVVGQPQRGSRGRIREHTYDYRDRDGIVRYQVVRYRCQNGKKDFIQRASDGKGGWKTDEGCMKSVEPLPYRLPELLASDGVIWVFEGEKDVEAAARLGLTATTNSGGTGSTDVAWSKFGVYFAGRDVRIVPDNDHVGESHAHKVARHLRQHVRSVKVVSIPGLPPKGDLSDFLALGGEIEALYALESVIPEWSDNLPEAAAANYDPEADATVGDLRRIVGDDGWLWPNWIPRASLTLLAAEGGTGKTRFSFDLHRRIALGLPWPDGQPMAADLPSRRALWVVADNQWAEICDLATDFGIPDDLVRINSKAGDPYTGTNLETSEELADFEARIDRLKPAVVFIDTITNTGDFDCQDANAARKQYKPLQDIAARTGIAIVCVTHLNTTGKVLGRRAIEKVRVVIQLMACPDTWNRRRLWVEKSKALKPAPLGVTMGDGGNEYDDRPPEIPGLTSALVPTRKKPPGPSPAMKSAADWLRVYLSFEPGQSYRVSRVLNSAEMAGHAKDLIFKAVDVVGVVEDNIDGFKYWKIKERALAVAADRIAAA